MYSSDSWFIVGRIVSAQGLQGELRINPNSDFPERFTKPGLRWLQVDEETPKEIELISGRQLPGKSIFVIKFRGVSDRTSAEKLIGHKLLVPTSDRPKLKNGEFHLLDLIGLKVKLEPEGTIIGKVIDLTTAGNDLLNIELIGGRKVLIPFVKAIVPEVKLNEGWLKITPPPGLLDL